MAAQLFVYGTLLAAATSSLGSAERRRLQSQSTVLGAATTAGRLCDLGRYPGLVLSDDPAHIVHGELVELHDPALSLRWLDAYEGIAAGNRQHEEHHHDEYHRLVRPVELSVDLAAAGDRAAVGGGQLDAWVYVWHGDPQRVRLIDGGRWLVPI